MLSITQIKDLLLNVLYGFHNDYLKNKLVPPAGASGQIIMKNSDNDGDYSWSNLNIPETDLTGYATENYVNQKISEIEIPVSTEIDLSGYLTTARAEELLSNKSDTNHTHSNYLTEHQSLVDYVTTFLMNEELKKKANIEHTHDYALSNHNHSEYLTEHQDISSLATREELSSKADTIHSHSEYSAIDHIHSDYSNFNHTHDDVYSKLNHTHNYATESFVTTKIEEASISGNEVDLSGYYTKIEIDNKGYLTEHQDISGLATKEDLRTKANANHTHSQYLTEHQDVSSFALKTELFDKSYNSLTDKPVILSEENVNTLIETYIDNALGGVY